MAIQSASAKLYTGIRCWVVDKNISAALTASFSLGNQNQPSPVLVGGVPTVYPGVLVFRVKRYIADLVSVRSLTLVDTRLKTFGGGNNVITPGPIIDNTNNWKMRATVVCKFPTYFRIDVDKLQLPQGTTCTVSFEEDWVRDGVYLESTQASSAAIGNFFTFRTPWLGASFINAAFTLPTRTVLKIRQLSSSVNVVGNLTAYPIFNPGKLAALFGGVFLTTPTAVKTVKTGSIINASFVSNNVLGLRIKQLGSVFNAGVSTVAVESEVYNTPGLVNMASTATFTASGDRTLGPITAVIDAAGTEQGFTVNANAKKTAGSSPSITSISSMSIVADAQIGLPSTPLIMAASLSVSIDVPMILKYTMPSSGGTIYLPIHYGNMNFKVDWGDGSAVQTFTQRQLSIGGFNLGIEHTYNSAGDYIVKIFGTVEKFGKPRYSQLPNTTGTDALLNNRLIEIKSFGDLGTTSFEQAFSNCTRLQKVARRIPSTVTDISWMFWFSGSGNQESGWNVDDCQYWNTVNITNMSGTFMRCRQGFNAPIGNWNTINVTNMSFMFHFCSDETTGFNQNLNAWNVSSVTNMEQMFRQCKFYNQPMNNWDVSSVTNMFGMFWGENPINQFNQDLGAWDVSSVTNMSNMLYTGQSYTHNLSQWCVSNFPTEPANFVSNFGTVAGYSPPVWGTCP